MKKSIPCSCHTCHMPVRPEKHFTSEDGRILCYKCRRKEKVRPANTNTFVSALGVERSVKKNAREQENS